MLKNCMDDFFLATVTPVPAVLFFANGLPGQTTTPHSHALATNVDSASLAKLRMTQSGWH